MPVGKIIVGYDAGPGYFEDQGRTDAAELMRFAAFNRQNVAGFHPESFPAVIHFNLALDDEKSLLLFKVVVPRAGLAVE